MRRLPQIALSLVLLALTARCESCKTTPQGLDAGPDAAADGPPTLMGTSCEKPDQACNEIADKYCLPFLALVTGQGTPSTPALYVCAAQVKDVLNVTANPNDLLRAVNYLAICVGDITGTTDPADFRSCRDKALALSMNQPERGSVAPSNALTILGDRADRVRCAYAACPQFVGDCFADNPDGGGFPSSSGAVDSCLTYRLCLAACRQNIVDPARRSRCVLEQCDPPLPKGKQRFVAYRNCMLTQGAMCGQESRRDGGADGK